MITKEYYKAFNALNAFKLLKQHLEYIKVFMLLGKH